MNTKSNLITTLFAVVILQGSQLANAAQLQWQPITERTPIVLSQGPSIDPINFTCDSGTHSCSCQGTTDCYDLGNSKLCKDGTLKPHDSKPDTLVCDFKF